jgi:hypothetical protein
LLIINNALKRNKLRPSKTTLEAGVTESPKTFPNTAAGT